MDPKENILGKKGEEISDIGIKGINMDLLKDLGNILDQYKYMGFQGSHIGIAREILKEMKKDGAKIFLSFTSNLISSGLRDVIAYLTKKKVVDVIVTSGGGIEEDVIKTYKPFLLGSFEMNDRDLREKGINRIGNILVPNDRYIWFEKFMNKVFDKIKHTLQPSEVIKLIGEMIDDENSYIYWAVKNNIPVYCPTFLDGSIGDMYYFYRKSKREIEIAFGKDHLSLIDHALNAEKLGLIVLGGSTPKHQVINAALFRGGADYAVYISTGTEYDGSLSGAKPSEAVSWGKINRKAKYIFIEGDATIIFPLVIGGIF